jgi:hypothetical protein
VTCSDSRGDRGSVTAETATALPALVVVLLLSVWVLTCVAAQLRCVDAARVGAREAARGEAVTAVVAAARAAAPKGAEVLVRRDGERVEVLVRAAVRPLGGVLGVLPPTRVSARAAAAVEDPP